MYKTSNNTNQRLANYCTKGFVYRCEPRKKSEKCNLPRYSRSCADAGRYVRYICCQCLSVAGLLATDRASASNNSSLALG